VEGALAAGLLLLRQNLRVEPSDVLFIKPVYLLYRKVKKSKQHTENSTLPVLYQKSK
jgi:hypothetical protein